MTTTARWISMAATAAALALLFLPWGGDPGLFVPDEVEAAASGSCAADAKPAPLNFTVKDMNGVDVRLSSFKGKVILLNFWATWCGPCKAEIPALVELQTRYASDLVVLGMSVDDPVEKLKPFAAQYKMNYPVLVGLGREDVQDAFGPLYGIPMTFFIGRDGRICKTHPGIAPKAQIEREIRALL
ncbi:MAG: TlpA family protein disulfide reductase [Vicinamibacterales bacterium]